MEDIFMNSIVSGDFEGVRNFLESAAESRTKFLNVIFHDGSTPLNMAIANRYSDLAHLLIEYGCDVNLPDSFRLDGCRRKPIHYACAAGNLDLVKLLVEVYHVDVDDKDCGNSSPVHHSAASGHIDIVDYLVKAGCNIHHRSNSGKTALWKAASNGHREIVHFLYALGVDIDIPNQVGETVLFECSRKISLIAILADLVQFGASLTLTDVEMNSVLHLVSVAGNTLAAEVLISAGADVNSVNQYGNRPLHNAVMQGQTAVAITLLNNGANSLKCNVSHQSPLYVAMLHLQMNSCRLLRFAGTRLTSKEREMFEQYEYHRNERKKTFYHRLIRMFNAPLDLSSACRIVIRRHLTTSPVTSVQCLPMPHPLRQFLLLDDVVGFMLI